MNPRDFILSRSGSARRTREGYWAYLPDPLPPALEWDPPLLARLAEAERSVGELAATARLLPGFPAFFPLLAAREACLSCRIDGVQADLAEFLQSHFIPGGSFEAKPEVRAAHDYLEALNATQDRRPPSLEALARLHARLFAGDDLDQGGPGEFRSGQNWIGPPGSSLETAVFIPPPAERLERDMALLEAFSADPAGLTPLVSLGLIHYQFEALHPFPTGNGRLGRILIARLPAAWGILPLPLIHLSAYLLQHRKDYFDGLLAVSQRSAWADWLTFFLQGVSNSARNTAALLVSLQDQQEQWLEAISARRTAARLGQLLKFLSARPIFTIRQVESALGVNFAVAQRYVNQFEGIGIVEEITGQARNRVYCARGIMGILTATP